MSKERISGFIAQCMLVIVLCISCLYSYKERNDKVTVAVIDSACSEDSEIQYSHCDLVLQAFTSMLQNKCVNYEIMIVDILNMDGSCSITSLIQAIEYAEKNGAEICNLSLSTYSDDQKLRAVIEKSNMLFVVAAGNEGENLDRGFPSYPTNYKLDNVISVAALDDKGNLLEMSNYGENTVDIAVNGIITCENERAEGTSIATGKMSAMVTMYFCLSEKKQSANECKKEVLTFVKKNNSLQEICELL